MVAEMKGKSKLCLQVEKDLQWLSQFGADTRKGVTRLLYSTEWYAAQEALKEKMTENQLTAYYDDVGNLYGRLEGIEQNQKTILVGSHVDTVVYGGKYDGAFGIIAGLIAVEHLRKTYGMPKRSIEVVSLCEEEGSRFPLTYWGSGHIVGLYNYENMSQEIKDRENITLKKAMEQYQFGKGHYKKPFRQDISHFIELHIEQGEQLEKKQLDIGIVSSIAGQKRFTVTVQGESNHAGTTPMTHRKDALAASCRFITSLLDMSKKYEEKLYMTVGKLDVSPNVPNVIPGKVSFSIDIRHGEDGVLDKVEHEIKVMLREIAINAGVTTEINRWMNEKPVQMDKNLSEISKNISEEKNISYMSMVSGAGHDSQVFGPKLPTCLLFVPSKNGISHSPKEYTSAEQLEKGIQVLIELLYKLAY
ncbi:allantoate deiminase [Priestia flexa]|uniref:allantoate deiminase n=1 Tax=Priestia flexa TaxID=86664 RepID=UPI003CFC2381